jgi:hypothetical protein
VALRETALADADIEHTVDAAADPGYSPHSEAVPVAGPTNFRKAWQQPATNRTVVGLFETPLAVSATIGADDRSGIAVHDNRTGAERWHFHTSSFGLDDSVAVDPLADRLLMIIGAAAVLLDLDSGTEVDRIALPEPSHGPTLGATHYQIIGSRPDVPTYADERPRVEITGNVVHIAVTARPGPTDVLSVDLLSGRVSTLATELPENCRFRTLQFNEYTIGYDFHTWLLRDGVGCGTPTLTRMYRGGRQIETPVAQSCDPPGCELPDAYATSEELVIHTGTRLLTFDVVGALQSSTPIEPDRRSVVLPNRETPTLLPAGVTPRGNAVFAKDGATLFQYQETSPGSGRVVRIDTATGRESAPSETVRCTDPALSISAAVLILSCRTGVIAFG